MRQSVTTRGGTPRRHETLIRRRDRRDRLRAAGKSVAKRGSKPAVRPISRRKRHDRISQLDHHGKGVIYAIEKSEAPSRRSSGRVLGASGHCYLQIIQCRTNAPIAARVRCGGVTNENPLRPCRTRIARVRPDGAASCASSSSSILRGRLSRSRSSDEQLSDMPPKSAAGASFFARVTRRSKTRAGHAIAMRPELKAIRKICCFRRLKPTFF